MHQKCSNYALINLLFGLCRSMWVINLLVILPSPYSGAPTCPSTPEVLQVRECVPTPYHSAVFTFRFAVESTKVLGSALTTNSYLAQHLDHNHPSFLYYSFQNSNNIICVQYVNPPLFFLIIKFKILYTKRKPLNVQLHFELIFNYNCNWKQTYTISIFFLQLEHYFALAHQKI
jgi:hypothetical protein